MGLALFLGRADVFPGLPAHRPQHPVGELDGLVVGHRADGVVPAVEESADGNHRQNLDDLRIRVMLAELLEMLRLDGAGRRARGECQVDCRPLRVREPVGLVVVPQRLNPLIRHVDPVEVIGAVGLTVKAAVRHARRGKDELLELTRDLPAGEHELEDAVHLLPQLGPVLHLEVLPVVIAIRCHDFAPWVR